MNGRDTVRSLCLVLAMLATPMVAVAQAADSTAASAEEVEAWRAARARYNERLTELDNDTRRLVDIRAEEVRARLTSGYDQLIDTLAQLELSQRSLAQARFEGFLDRYDDSPEADSVRFRLADIYFERAKDDYLESDRQFSLSLDTDDLDDLDSLADTPVADYSPSIALYERIVADNLARPVNERYERLDAVYVMLGYCFSAEESLQRDTAFARESYRGLIDNVPGSELLDRAHLQIGNFLFDDNRLSAAAAEYQRVYDKGPEGGFYDRALYQLAWTYYKDNEFDLAMQHFVELLDRSEDRFAATGRVSEFAPDAIKFMAFSLNDLHDRDFSGRTAMQIATDYFAKIGERPYQWDVFVQLADVLTRYSKTAEAVDVYTTLQSDQRYRHRPENPMFQQYVVDIFARDLLLRDDIKAGEARLVLTDRYREGSDWYLANRNNPEALSTARKYIEESLIFVAQEHLARAQEQDSVEEYNKAVARYREYLEKFPIADDFYTAQWFLVASLVGASDLDAAEVEGRSLMRSSRYHPYGDGAIALVFDIVQRRLIASNGLLAPPEGATVERAYTTPGGREVTRYAVETVLADFVQMSDVMLSHKFTEPPPDATSLPDVRDYVDSNRPALSYQPGQALFYRNRYDEARERLEVVVSKYPRTRQGSQAATLILDSYALEGDLDKLRQYAQKYSMMSIGEAGKVDVDGKFASRLEDASFKLAMQYAEQGEYEQAALAFIQFRGDFPRARLEIRQFALENAAFYYQEIGRIQDANRLYEQFINEYPKADASRPLFLRIASNYEQSFELEKAIDYYERLVRNFPSATDAPIAVYNAAFLRVGLGRHAEAAAGYERYSRDFKDQGDRERTQFRACEQFALVSDARALECWPRYLKEYGYENPDRALEAMAAIAGIYDRRGDRRAFDRQQDEIIKAFDAIVAGGGEVLLAGRDYAAGARIRYVIEAYDKYATDKLTGNFDRDSAMLSGREAKIPEIAAMADDVLRRYGSFEHGTRASYIKAMLLLNHADLGLSIRPPKGLSDDQEIAFFELLDERVFPVYREFEDKGIEALVEIVEFAKRSKRHAEAIDLAVAELNRRRPAQYPALKREVVGQVDSSNPVVVKPLMRSSAGEDTAPAKEVAPAPAPAEPAAPPADAPAPEGTP